MDILELLTDYQQRNRLTDREMADRLGINFTYWNRLRRGKVQLPRPVILAGFARLFPRKMGMLREYLTGAEDDDDTA